MLLSMCAQIAWLGIQSGVRGLALVTLIYSGQPLSAAEAFEVPDSIITITYLGQPSRCLGDHVDCPPSQSTVRALATLPAKEPPTSPPIQLSSYPTAVFSRLSPPTSRTTTQPASSTLCKSDWEVNRSTFPIRNPKCSSLKILVS